MAFLGQALPRVMGAPLVAEDQVAGHPRAPRKWSLRASPRKETRTSRSAKGEARAEDPDRKAAAQLGGNADQGPNAHRRPRSVWMHSLVQWDTLDEGRFPRVRRRRRRMIWRNRQPRRGGRSAASCLRA